MPQFLLKAPASTSGSAPSLLDVAPMPMGMGAVVGGLKGLGLKLGKAYYPVPRLAQLGLDFPSLTSERMLPSWINKVTGQIIHGLSPKMSHDMVLGKELGVGMDKITGAMRGLWQRAFTHPESLKTWPDFAVEALERGEHFVP